MVSAARLLTTAAQDVVQDISKPYDNYDAELVAAGSDECVGEGVPVGVGCSNRLADVHTGFGVFCYRADSPGAFIKNGQTGRRI